MLERFVRLYVYVTMRVYVCTIYVYMSIFSYILTLRVSKCTKNVRGDV